jgi:signal transduction histidine kinase
VSEAPELWWIFIAATLTGLILVAAFVASIVIQQRRFLSTTRAFGGRVLAAQEEERARLARELHDDLIQRVAMLGQELEQLERSESVNGAGIRLAGIREELHDLAGEIRRLAHRMHPAVLDHLGLPAALSQLAAEFTQQGLRVDVEIALPASSIPAPVATCLYRVAQESLRNAHRHSQSNEARISLTAENEGICLRIEDTGVGFDTTSRSSRSGLGLTSIAERLRLVGGRLGVRSAPGQGTRISAWVPMESLAPVARAG